MDSELLLIAFTTINGYVFAKYRYCLLVYENPFLEIHPFTGGGNLSQLVYLTPHPWWVGGYLSQLVYLAPHPDFWAVNGNGFWIAVNYFLTINGYVSQNTDTACWYTKNHFLKFTQIQVGGNISQLVYLTPHPRFWNGDCLHIMKWLWSITLLKMMKISYNPDIFCLFTLISHLKYLRWWVGGNLSQLVYLAPHSDFWAVIGYGFWIAANCCYNY